MLARENRLIRADDFRFTMRNGAKQATGHLVVYLKRVELDAPARFGFITPKAVGGAVQRNLVKRRLRAIARLHLVSLGGFQVVVRALEGSAILSFEELNRELAKGIAALLGKVK